MTCITQIRITMVLLDSQSCKYIRSYPISYHSDVVFWVSGWFHSQFHYVQSTFILLAKSFLSRFIRFSKADLTQILRKVLYMCLWSWQLWCLSASCARLQAFCRCPLHAERPEFNHMWYLWWQNRHSVQVFFSSISVSLCQCHSTKAPPLFIYPSPKMQAYLNRSNWQILYVYRYGT